MQLTLINELAYVECFILKECSRCNILMGMRNVNLISGK